jgi:hypothetical protein
MNKVQICGEKLKDPLLLVNIVKEIQKEGIVGEEDTILALIMKIMLRYVKDVDATSSNLVVSDKSGGGKDYIVETICSVLLPKKDYYHRTGLTEKVFRYWHSNKKDFTWNGKVIHLEDPESDLIKSQVFRTMASGGSENTVVDNQKAVDLKVNGKPVILVTSYNTNIDMEGIRRWDTIRMDTGKILTEKVIANRMLKKAGLYIKEEDKELREALHSILCERNVIVPFVGDIIKVFPNFLAMRTISGKFMDYIKASAVLHQYQRETDVNGNIIASLDDYEYARFVFMKLSTAFGVPLNSVEENFMNILIDAGEPLSVKEIAERFDHSIMWIYRNVKDEDKFKETGLIHEITTWDEKSNKEVTKYYTKVEAIKITLTPARLLTGENGWFSHDLNSVDDVVLTSKPLGFNMPKNEVSTEEKTSKKRLVLTFCGCVRELNKMRQNAGIGEMVGSADFLDIDTTTYLLTNYVKTTTKYVLEACEKDVKHALKPCENQTINTDNTMLKPKTEKESISLLDSIMDLSNKITQNRQAGYSITYDFLTHLYDKQFIDKCIQEGVLTNNGKEYNINYS